mgnify:CR=1 FL=1
MGLMTTLRTRMTVVLWALLILFILSMAVGGLVGGANIIDQIAGRVDPSRVIARINDQDISPDYFNNLVNQQINQLYHKQLSSNIFHDQPNQQTKLFFLFL